MAARDSRSSTGASNSGAVHTAQRPHGALVGSSSSPCSACMRQRPSRPSANIASCSRRRSSVTAS